MPAFHTALPYVKDRLRPISLHPLHIDNASHIQRHNDPFKGRTYLREHLLFRFRKIIAAFFRLRITVFPRSTSNDNEGRIAFFCRFLHRLIIERHFLLAPGFLRPSGPPVKGMRFQPCPIDFFQFLIQHKLFFF